MTQLVDTWAWNQPADFEALSWHAQISSIVSEISPDAWQENVYLTKCEM